MFAEAFISCGGIETLLVLLQREAKAGDDSVSQSLSEENEGVLDEGCRVDHSNRAEVGSPDEGVDSSKGNEPVINEGCSSSVPLDIANSASTVSTALEIERSVSISENPFLKNLGGITFSISADNARNNVYNIDKRDGIVVAIIGLVGALVAIGLLKSGSPVPSDVASYLLGGGLHEGSGSMFEDKVSILFFALQKAIQAAANRLMTHNVYMALLAASVGNCSIMCMHLCVPM